MYTLKPNERIYTACILVASIFVTFWVISTYWSGYAYFIRLFDSNASNLVSLLTGGRFSSPDSDVLLMSKEVFDNSPTFGFGLGSTQLLDSGYLEVFYQGGIAAILPFFCLLIYLHIYPLIKTKRISILLSQDI